MIKPSQPVMTCDIPDCNNTSPIPAPGWIRIGCYPPGLHVEKHLCPGHAAAVTVKQITDSATPKPQAPAAPAAVPEKAEAPAAPAADK